MFKGMSELIAQRRGEIIDACEQLYQTMSFREAKNLTRTAAEVVELP